MKVCFNIRLALMSILLLSLFIYSESSIRKLENTSKIILKINEIGEQYIINESFRPLPSKISINGKEVEKIDPKVNITEENSIIELIWNETLTNCHQMFVGLSNIEEIDFTEFDTSQVTDMSKMFLGCESLKSLDLSGFDTSKVTDMSGMFSKCTDLKNLEISNFNTGKVTNMERMFEFCPNLESLDIHNFDTSSVKNMDYMFHSCSNLNNLELSEFDTSNVKSMMAMFAGCFSLDTINMTFFDTSKVVNASYMFYDTKMIRLDLSDFEGSSIIFIDEALKYNPNLKYINLKNYKGKDIFSDLEDDTEITICTEDEVLEQTSNLPSLKEKNIINNCSDYCFSEFGILKENKTNCEIDCNKVTDAKNPYYDLCNENSDSSQLSILLYGYDSYSFINNLLSFSIYFFKISGNSLPRTIFFTISLIFNYITRILEEVDKNITCSLEDEDKLAKYNCEYSPNETINITGVSINYDFNFNTPFELTVTPLAEFNKDKIHTLTQNSIHSKDLVILYGNLTQKEKYFSITGKLNETDEIDDKFNLSVFSETSSLVNISCEKKEEDSQNLEIQCQKDKSLNYTINNSISLMENKSLLVILDKAEIETNNNTSYRIYRKNENNSLSAGGIVAIIIPLVLICIITLFLVFRKNIFNPNQDQVIKSTMMNLDSKYP